MNYNWSIFLEIVLTFHCLHKLFKWSQKFSRSLEQFFITVGHNNFGNKIQFLHHLYRNWISSGGLSKHKFSIIKNPFLVKCGFCMKLLLYQCNFDQLPTFFILSSLLGGFAVALLLYPPKSDDKWKKWSTGQSCIRKEVTSYTIRILTKTHYWISAFEFKSYMALSIAKHTLFFGLRG